MSQEIANEKTLVHNKDKEFEMDPREKAFMVQVGERDLDKNQFI